MICGHFRIRSCWLAKVDKRIRDDSFLINPLAWVRWRAVKKIGKFSVGNKIDCSIGSTLKRIENDFEFDENNFIFFVKNVWKNSRFQVVLPKKSSCSARKWILTVKSGSKSDKRWSSRPHLELSFLFWILRLIIRIYRMKLGFFLGGGGVTWKHVLRQMAHTRSCCRQEGDDAESNQGGGNGTLEKVPGEGTGCGGYL